MAPVNAGEMICPPPALRALPHCFTPVQTPTRSALKPNPRAGAAPDPAAAHGEPVPCGHHANLLQGHLVPKPFPAVSLTPAQGNSIFLPFKLYVKQ